MLSLALTLIETVTPRRVLATKVLRRDSVKSDRLKSLIISSNYQSNSGYKMPLKKSGGLCISF